MAIYLKGMALGAEMMIVDPVNALLWMANHSRVSLHLPFFRRTVTADTRF
jgi:DNA primase